MHCICRETKFGFQDAVKKKETPVIPAPELLETLTIIGMEIMKTELNWSMGRRDGILVNNDNEILV